jgi:ParB-like chromosome segregation protein Spo0J
MNERISIDQLDPSPTQPRKHFYEKEHDELTNSMIEHGFAFGSLLLREKPDGRFEIVIGERRVRAARAAISALKKGVIDQDVRKRLETLEFPRCSTAHGLSDNKVIELQLIENLQREDLSPIEEAEGYRQMKQLRDDQKKPLYTVAAIAKQIGKAENTIWERLSLCELEGEAREAVESGLLSPKIGVLIARITDEKSREKFAKAVLHSPYNIGPVSFREAKDLLAREYTCDLRGAPFDLTDAVLLPLQHDVLKGRVSGGACIDCPFRSGNVEKGLPSSKQNICTNPACFNLKLKAEWLFWQNSETDLAKKRRALDREECDRIYGWGDELHHASGLVDLSQKPDSSDLRPGESAPGTWRSLTKERELEILVARDKDLKKRKAHELVRRDLAIEAAKLNGHKIFRDGERKRAKPEEMRKIGRRGLKCPHCGREIKAGFLQTRLNTA